MLEFIKDYWFLITFAISVLVALYEGGRKLNETLLSIKHQLEISNINHKRAVEESIKDRRQIRDILEEHDDKLDNHNERLIVLENNKVSYKEEYK